MTSGIYTQRCQSFGLWEKPTGITNYYCVQSSMFTWVHLLCLTVYCTENVEVHNYPSKLHYTLITIELQKELRVNVVFFTAAV